MCTGQLQRFSSASAPGISAFLVDAGGMKDLYRRRHKDPACVDRIVELHAEVRKAQYEVEQKRQAINSLDKDIHLRKKANEDATALVARKQESEEQEKDMKLVVERLKRQLDVLLREAPNVLHPSVVVSGDEDHNEVVRTVGAACRPPTMAADPGAEVLNHVALCQRLGASDLVRGRKVAGHRGYFLLGPGRRLKQALTNYGFDFLQSRGYTEVSTPFFMNRDVMAKCAQLDQFNEELYKVTGGDESEDKYLIATSEQTLAALHMDECLDPHHLPLRYAGESTCFRKEAGSHGADTLGIFRTHQFEKIEQFVICRPEQSWEMHEEMLRAAEEFYSSLGIPYRVVSIVSGALNNAAAKKYDLEGWFPASKSKFGSGLPGVYRELVSCSNCTDYQARRLNIRFGPPDKQADQSFVHMLNCTLTAIQRTICAIVENHQTPSGVRVPLALQPYMRCDFLPFVDDKTGKGGGRRHQRRLTGPTAPPSTPASEQCKPAQTL